MWTLPKTPHQFKKNRQENRKAKEVNMEVRGGAGTEHGKMLKNNKRQQTMHIPLAVTSQHGTVYFSSSERPELNPGGARSIWIWRSMAYKRTRAYTIGKLLIVQL